MDLETLKIDRTRRSPRRSSGPWFARLVALGLLALAVWFFWSPLTRLSDRVRLPQVEVFVVRAESAGRAAAIGGTASNGYVVAARRAALSADTPGRVVAMHVSEGQHVRAGDIVAELFAGEVSAALARATADAVAAKAELAQAQFGARSSSAARERAEQDLTAAREDAQAARARSVLGQVEWERIAPLVEGGVVSARELDAAVSERDASAARLRASESLLAGRQTALSLATIEVEASEANIARAEARVESAIATRDQAQATLDKTYVRAPFDGVVVLKDAEVGEVVSPNSQGGSNARGAVCTLVDFNSLEVQCDVPETSLANIELNSRAAIYLDAWPDHRYDGRVDRIWPTADRQKATVEVRVTFDERDERLRPDMGARVVFGVEPPEPEPSEAESAPPALLVPSGAIVEIDGQAGVFVIERDTVRFQALRLGESRNGRVEALEGLQAGLEIVRAAPDRLAHGDRVRIKED